MVSHTDLPPTLLDLAGAFCADLDGRSLVPVFSAGGEHPAGWREEVFVEDLGRGWNMLRTPRWAYVEWDDGEKELYDMHTDRYQLHSLHAEPDKADLIARLAPPTGCPQGVPGRLVPNGRHRLEARSEERSLPRRYICGTGSDRLMGVAPGLCKIP